MGHDAENDRPRVTWADVRAARREAWEAETAPRAENDVLRWNDDKKHRCPACHAVAMDERPSSLAVYECCRCHTRFARWPWLARVLPFRGVVCPEHRPLPPA